MNITSLFKEFFQIAFFYTKTLLWNNLLIAVSIFILLLAFNRLKIRNLIPYIAGGVAMWYFMLHSGVHATITGVLLAFDNETIINNAKLVILLSSLIAGLIGYVSLKRTLKM